MQECAAANRGSIPEMDPIIEDRFADADSLRAALRLGLHPVVARVLAHRAGAVGVEPDWLLDFSLHSLDPPDGLPDIDRAAQRVARAILNGEIIALATDADSDGVNAHVVLTRGLADHLGHPRERLQHYIGLKLSEGYGLSDRVCERMLAAEPRPDLVITADIGSSDGPRIERLAAAGIDTVVTDHHGVPASGGPNALAFVNPQRSGTRYPDPLIAGVMVAWLLLWAVRRRLIETGHLSPRSPSLGALLGWVATGTVADVVSLARSRNNRIVVRAGIDRIEAGDFPCWRALRRYLGDPAKPLSAQDLAFGIGPRLNAAGRLHDAMTGVRFLLAEDDQVACDGAVLLDETNQARRVIEKRLTEEAMGLARPLVAGGASALSIPLAEGHAGVHGIVASRLMQAFARPTACFSPHPEAPGLLTGSCRSVDEVPMLEVLQRIDSAHPGLLLKYGGHAGAAGLTFEQGRFREFEAALDREAARCLDGRALRPRLRVDADIEPGALTLTLVRALEEIGPYGREFPEAILRGAFTVCRVREVGNAGAHWRLTLDHGGSPVDGIWFNAGPQCPVTSGETAVLLFTPEANWWQGRPRLQIRIVARER
jgi:single-stranded-DNA-specific exonuclease